jgi:hypothetical protein
MNTFTSYSPSTDNSTACGWKDLPMRRSSCRDCLTAGSGANDTVFAEFRNDPYLRAVAARGQPYYDYESRIIFGRYG